MNLRELLIGEIKNSGWLCFDWDNGACLSEEFASFEQYLQSLSDKELLRVRDEVRDRENLLD